MSICLLFLRSKLLQKNISINLKIMLAILNDFCYYIDKDRYRFDDKYINVNMLTKNGIYTRRT